MNEKKYKYNGKEYTKKELMTEAGKWKYSADYYTKLYEGAIEAIGKKNVTDGFECKHGTYRVGKDTDFVVNKKAVRPYIDLEKLYKEVKFSKKLLTTLVNKQDLIALEAKKAFGSTIKGPQISFVLKKTKKKK